MPTVFHLPVAGREYGARALRNIQNLFDDTSIDGRIALVANGGGVAHLLEHSPHAETVNDLIQGDVEVCACRNTIERADYEADALVAGVRVVSSGMGELTRKQAEGYAYVRP